MHHASKLLPSPRRIALALSLAALVAACGEGHIGEGAFVDHEVDEDYESISATVPGIPNSFQRNNVLDDAVFTNLDLSGDQVQSFLENAPYFGGIRSWIADVQVSGMRASDALVAAARAENVNPLMLLARLQVEKSAISRSQRPSQHTIDYTMGCGCPDNQSCNTAFKGFDKQMACAAQTLRRHFDGSVAGTGQWRRGRTRSSLDPVSVTPANHATASLYSYTPWVLQGAGGNWLVWNVTKKYANAFKNITGGSQGGGSSTPQPSSGGPWIGDSCQSDSSCDLNAGSFAGECLNWFDEDSASLHGMCSSDCAGFCPDMIGEAPTFCAQIQGSGQCVAEAASQNGNCSEIPGTQRIAKPRFLGASSSSSVWRDVCAPANEAITCSLGGNTGTCVNANTNSCSGGTLHSGACPGPNEIQCCVP